MLKNEFQNGKMWKCVLNFMYYLIHKSSVIHLSSSIHYLLLYIKHKNCSNPIKVERIQSVNFLGNIDIVKMDQDSSSITEKCSSNDDVEMDQDKSNDINAEKVSSTDANAEKVSSNDDSSLNSIKVVLDADTISFLSSSGLRNDWDPLSTVSSRMPTKDCLKRVRNDIKSLYKDPLPGICIYPDEVIATMVHAILIGPWETPYEGGFFYFVLDFPDDYPREPPRVRLITTGSGTCRFNPNLYANGKVCLSLLNTWHGEKWSMVNTLSSVLLSIQSIMCEKPYHNEPGFEVGVGDTKDASAYNDIIRHETVRIAVCDMCDPRTVLHKSLPPLIQSFTRSMFTDFYDIYEETCTSNLRLDGQVMRDPFGDKRGSFSYKSILDKLSVIKGLIQELSEKVDDDEYK